MIRRIISLGPDTEAALRPLAEQFFAESKLSGELNYDFLVMNIRKSLDASLMGLWVLEVEDRIVGAIGGVLTSHIFTGDVIAIETFWFVTEEHRRGLGGARLLNMFIDWAAKCDASQVHVAHMEHIHPDRMAEFYIGQRFSKLETIYVRSVWQ